MKSTLKFRLLFIMSVVIASLFLVENKKCFAQAGLVRRATQEIFEMVGKKLGREGAKELSEKIGREGIEEILERALREGGEEAVSRVVRVGGNHGASALRVLKESPVQFARLLDDIPADQIKMAINAIERQPKLMSEAVEKYGTMVLATELKHPGVGIKTISSLGDDAINLGQRLSTDQMTRVAHFADDIAKLPASQRSEFINMLANTPGKVFNALETHPNVLKACTVLGIALPVGLKAVEGTTEQVLPDGTLITTKGPLVDGGTSQAVESVGEGFNFSIKFIGVALAISILLTVTTFNAKQLTKFLKTLLSK